MNRYGMKSDAKTNAPPHTPPQNVCRFQLHWENICGRLMNIDSHRRRTVPQHANMCVLTTAVFTVRQFPGKNVIPVITGAMKMHGSYRENYSLPVYFQCVGMAELSRRK